MIQANELRIGNLVLQDGKMKSVNYIDAAFVYKFVAFKGEEFNADNLYADRECDPIPLTEEILLKCGFKNRSIGSDFWFECNEIIIGGTGKSFYPSVSGESGLEAYGDEIKFLHQLQNLYFALTGEELTVNI